MYLVMMLFLAFSVPSYFPTASEEKEAILQGKLQITEGKATILMDQGKVVALESDIADVAATLSDGRISGRPVKVLGRFRADGVFLVREFYVVRPESLYRIIYFCDTCHITTFAPGDCACCQQPTVPIEVLPTDPRIYHEEVKSQPGPR